MGAKLSPGMRIFVTSFATILAMVVVAGSMMLLGLFDDMIESRLITFVVNLFVAIINISLISYLMKKLDHVHIKEMGFRVERKDLFFVLTAFIVTLTLILSYVGVLIHHNFISGTFNISLLKELNFYLLFLVACIGWIFAASHEEVLTRGYFMKNLSHRKILSMLLISPLLFTIIHIPFRGLNPAMLLTWFFGGISYSYLYLKSGSLSVTTLVHAIHNITNDLAFYNLPNFSLFSLAENLTSHYKGYYELLLCISIIFLTFIFYGKNGFFTPAHNLSNFWEKHKNEVKVEQVNKNSVTP
ncbi:membrane protease YdiL (CAAX protease family) [Bacillus mesophilus]|uniref:CPBP family intramembrane metalloprotease n=1 Tax=Bacillus mesophilus TaxID=1808955 RepID=A0A6M0Q8D2_9BACI|nr:type II CAAX endopeptidase family protein [Bacillus mesophilus]MBM7662017.1 membrane protease YdiL (CAAX protease family) [Bacillus mesophilus]NEY72626.1 CPBP family intramembrane metalloprotease [Bacillus mesophilus]